MAVSEISGIAGTVSGGGGGVSNQGFERFAEMMLRMREARQQEAAQKLDTSFKIFDATGMMPSESDLKGPLKQLGVTLTPEMMEQLAQRGQELRTSRSEAAKTQTAQRHAAEATAAGAQMDVEKQQQRLALGQRLSQAPDEASRNRILREGLDLGLIDPKDLTDEDKWQMTLSRIDPNKPSPEPGVSMREYMDDAHARLVAGLMSPDQVAKNKQDRADQLARDAAENQYRMEQIGLQLRQARSEEERTRLEGQRVALEGKRFDLETKATEAKMFAEKYNAIADYIKSNKQGALDAFKSLYDARKAGVKVDQSVTDQVMRDFARSLAMRGVAVLDGKPVGIEEFQKVIETQEPKTWIDRILGRKEQTFLFESATKRGEDIEAAKGATEAKKPESTAKSVGRFLGGIASGKTQEAMR